MKNLAKRTIVAAIFIPILIYIYYIGGPVLFGFLSIVTALCVYELNKMIYKQNYVLLSLNILLGLLLFYMIAASSYTGEWGGTDKCVPYMLDGTDKCVPYLWIIFILLCTMLINGAASVFTSKIEGAFFCIAGSLFAVFYPAMGFGLMYKLQHFHISLIPALAILVWICDSAAYFIGMKFGKHRGVFKCSPQKSVEGFIAGFVSVAVFSSVLLFIIPDFYNLKLILVLTTSIGIFGQFGDLFESILKRDMKIKDSSNILPGHGGILDRFDSLLIAAPILYFYLELIPSGYF